MISAEKAKRLRAVIERSVSAAGLDDETALEAVELFPAWETGRDYAAGTRVRHKGGLYECETAHTSAAEWSPPAAASLWSPVKVNGETGLDEWTRPTGAHNAYKKGDIHCVVGQCTAERIGEIFAPESREASSNYGIGLDGRIGMYVEEKDRSWCTSSGANDHRAVTIEVASDTAHPYAVKAAAFSALLDLCADICKRNGKKRLLWFGDKEKTLAYTPKADEMVLTVHRWFANKACPGEYLYSRHGEIAAEVTKRLAAEDKPAGTGDNPSAWAKAATEYCKRKGIFAGDGAGNFDWQKPITREQVAAVLYRTLERAGLLEALPDKK